MICIHDGKQTDLSFAFLLRGVARTQERLCRDAGYSYCEEDDAQSAMTRSIVTDLLGSAGTEEFERSKSVVSARALADACDRVFSASPFTSQATQYPDFVLENFFTRERRRITAMGMTDGGRVRLRYTVKRPRELVRPGNIPNENRMTMANYVNEVGSVPMRGKIVNPDHAKVCQSIIDDVDLNAQPEAVLIGQMEEWLLARHTSTALKRFDAFTSYLDNIHNVDIYDSLLPGWTRLKKWMKCTDPNLRWFRIKTSTGVNRLFTFDHPLPIQGGAGLLRIPTEELKVGMTMFGCRTDRKSGARRAIPIEIAEHKAVSHDLIPPVGYDVETESDHFDLDTIVTHNCRTRSICR
ncbi:MAG: hypothetical protein IJU76_14550 [Desulfovibrionaceae bacterium]|nr:hypothetical protein [Desulfovibrionaceae bacterium]